MFTVKLVYHGGPYDGADQLIQLAAGQSYPEYCLVRSLVPQCPAKHRYAVVAVTGDQTRSGLVVLTLKHDAITKEPQNK